MPHSNSQWNAMEKYGTVPAIPVVTLAKMGLVQTDVNIIKHTTN